jgi:hypothetical protein
MNEEEDDIVWIVYCYLLKFCLNCYWHKDRFPIIIVASLITHRDL